MNLDKVAQQYQHQKKKKKCNKNQHTRKQKQFKKKHRKLCNRVKQILDSNVLPFKDIQRNQQLQDSPVLQHSSIQLKLNPLDIKETTDPTLLLTDYSKITDLKFKQMLLQSITESTNKNALIQSLDTEGTLVFIRHLTQLSNKLNYFQLQYEHWTFFYNLGITQGIWTGRVSKKMAIDNSMCYTYGRSRVLIRQRQKKYQQHIELIQNDIDNHMKQASSFIQITRIMNIIQNLIQNDQHLLRLELERRKTLLKFDAKEHHLVHEFYQLKPRQTEVRGRIIHLHSIPLLDFSRFVQLKKYGKPLKIIKS